MAYSDYLDDVQKLYMGYYLRPADPAGLMYWAQALETAGGGSSVIINAFATSQESMDLWGEITGANIGNVVNAIYNGLFGRDAEQAGLDWYVSEFNAGNITAGEIVLAVLDGAQNEDLAIMNNKLAWANAFTEILDPDLDMDPTDDQATYAGEADADAARAMLANVDATTVIDVDDITDMIADQIADMGDFLYRDAGQHFNLVAASAAGADVMRLTGDSEVRIDMTNPAAQIKGLDLNGDGTISLDGVENNQAAISAQHGAANFEIIDAYARNPLNQTDVNSNYLGDINFDGTGFGGDGVSTDGNIYLGGLGVDTAFGGIGNDFMVGGGVAAARFQWETNALGVPVLMDTLYDIPVVGGTGADNLSAGRNADFFYAELSALDPTDGNGTTYNGGNTTDDSAAGLPVALSGLNSQNNDWFLLEASDDNEPVFINLGAGADLNGDGTPDGLLTASGQTITLVDIESVDASGNLYGFLNGMDVKIGARSWDLRANDPVIGTENYAFGSTAQLNITGSDAANVIIGGYDNDQINGGDGDDLLMGGNLRYLLENMSNPNILDIPNNGMDVIVGGGGNDDIVFEADGGIYEGGWTEDADDVALSDTLWLTEDIFGAETAANVIAETIPVVRMDLGTGRVGGRDNYAGYGGADQGGTINAYTSDQTNYAAGYKFAQVQDMGNLIATGLGNIDFLAAGTNDPELNFNNQQNFGGVGDLNLDLRGTDTQNVIYADAGDDIIEGRDGDDLLSGGLGIDDFYFGTTDALLAPALQGRYGDGIDVIHRQRDDNNDNLWDALPQDLDNDGLWDGVLDFVDNRDLDLTDGGTAFPVADLASMFTQDFGSEASSTGTSVLQFSIIRAGGNLPGDELDDIINRVDEIRTGLMVGGVFDPIVMDSAEIKAATTYVELVAAINDALDATAYGDDLTAELQSNGITIFIRDALGREMADHVSEVDAGISISQKANTDTENLFDYGPPVVTVTQDRVIYKAYEDRADNEAVDDDGVTGSIISLGIDSYAQDRVVDISADGTRIAEEQRYNVTFTELTTEDVVTVNVNGVTYQLQVGVDVDGTQVNNEDGLGENQATIQENFLNRYAAFINSFMDDDTAAGQINAVVDDIDGDGNDDTLVITQVNYNGEETVFMAAPVVTIQNNSGGEKPGAMVTNVSDHELLLYQYDGSDNGLNRDNVLFVGQEFEDGGRTSNYSRSIMETAKAAGGELIGLDAQVINGGADDLVDIASNLATDIRLQSDKDDDFNPGVFNGIDDETNGNFTVHGDDLLIGGVGVDQISGLTGDDRVIGSLGADTANGGGDYYFVRHVGETKGTRTYYENAYAAQAAFADPANNIVESYVIEQTQNGVRTVRGVNFVDYFQDTLQFEQADFTPGATRFTVTLNNFDASTGVIQLRNGGAGTVGVDTDGNGTIESTTTFTNFENIRTVSGVGLAVADNGQGNDTINISSLSTSAATGGVSYDLTNSVNPGLVQYDANLSLLDPTDADADGDLAERTWVNVIRVDGPEHVITGSGEDELYIDETEAAKDNTFNAGLGVDTIFYLNDYRDVDLNLVTFADAQTAEPTVTIKVETAADTDVVSMTGGRVGTTVAEDLLIGVEQIDLGGVTAQGILENDTIDVTAMTTGAVVDYVNQQVRNLTGTVMVTIANMAQMENVVADGNDTVIVADSAFMTNINTTSDTWAERENIVIDSYLNYDMLDMRPVVANPLADPARLSIAQLRTIPAATLNTNDAGDIPEVRNFEQYTFDMGDGGTDIDTVDYSNEVGIGASQIAAIFNFDGNNTQYVMVNNDGTWGSDGYRGDTDRIDKIIDAENIVASQSESIIDLTRSTVTGGLKIRFNADDGAFSTNAALDRDVYRIQLSELDSTAPITGMNYLEYFDAGDNALVTQASASWNRIEGSDYDETIELTDHDSTQAHAFNLRGGDNEVNYNELTRSINLRIGLGNTFAANDTIIGTVDFTDGNGLVLPGQQLDVITSYAAGNMVAPGKIRIEASQDAEDSLNFDSGITTAKLFILGEIIDSSDVITVNLAGQTDSIELTGFEILRDDPLTDDVYTMTDLSRIFNNLTLVDTFPSTDHDTIVVFDDAVGWGAAGVDEISLEVLNDTFNFDFDVLDITGVTDTGLTIIGDDGPSLPLPYATFVQAGEIPGDATTGSLVGSTPVTVTINPAGDDDWYQMMLVAGTTYSINLEGQATAKGTLFDPFVYLYDTDGVTLLDSNDDGGQGRNSRLSFTPVTSGTYYVSAREWFDDSIGTETLTVTIGSDRDMVDTLVMGDLDVVDDVQLFDVLAFTEASVTSAGSTFVIDMDAGEFLDGASNVLFTFDGEPTTFDFSEVTSGITVDVVDVLPSLDVIITGGAGNDAITGAAGNDTLRGGAGNDVLDGNTVEEEFETYTLPVSNVAAWTNGPNTVGGIPVWLDVNPPDPTSTDADAFAAAVLAQIAAGVQFGVGGTVAQIETFTFNLNGYAVLAGDTFTFAVNGHDVTYTAVGGETADNIATALDTLLTADLDAWVVANPVSSLDAGAVDDLVLTGWDSVTLLDNPNTLFNATFSTLTPVTATMVVTQASDAIAAVPNGVTYDTIGNSFTVDFQDPAGVITTVVVDAATINNDPFLTTNGSTMIDDYITPVESADTYVFEATAAANGTDTINRFDLSDQIDFTAFFGGNVAAFNAGYSAASNGNDDVNGDVSVFNANGTALTAASLAAEFAAGVGGTAFDAVDPDPFGAGVFKAAILEVDNSIANEAARLWFVHDANDNGVIAAGEVALVGIVTDGGDLAWVAGNFI